MSNHVRSTIKVIANEAAISELSERIQKCEIGDIKKLIDQFYDNPQDDVEWRYENVGSKWVFLDGVNDDNEFAVESADYPPKLFFVRLYKVLSDIDSDVTIEIKYQDETNSPIGAIVIKNDIDNGPVFCDDFDDEYDLDSDIDEICDRQDELLSNCYEMIDDGDGTSVDEVE